MKTMLKICVLALGVTGCAIQGPSPIVSASGMTAPPGGGSLQVFAANFTASQTDPTNPAKAFAMVSDGVELQYQLCADFFRSAGKEQQRLLFGKDFLAVAGTLATGILGAVSAASGGVGNATAIAWTGLGTAAGVSGINLYARNFLFSEDNVSAVEDLTLKAVNAAKEAAISPDRQATYTFSKGVSALIDVQTQCEVHKILDLVRKSIGIARPYAVQDIETATSNVLAARIGDLVNGGNPVSPMQIQQLYWLVMLAPSETEKTELYKQLSSLQPAPTGSSTDAFAGRTERLKQLLRALPQSTIDLIVANIEKAKAPTLAAGSASNAVARLPSLPMPAGATSSSLGRISISLR